MRSAENSKNAEPKASVSKRQAELKARRHADGLKRCEVWAKPEHHPAIKQFAKDLEAANDR